MPSDPAPPPGAGHPAPLPIDVLRPAFEAALEAGPVVVSAPTGSGKSTRLPTWCPGRVLVVEPRRVACRSLAQRVAEETGGRLGDEVGYQVRDERRAGDATRVLFATPGIVLRLFDRLADWDTVVLDEFHERGLETDLLLALLHRQRPARLVVTSATLAGDRVAEHLGGRHLRGEGRAFPVEVRHRPGGTLLPDARGLEGRVADAVAAALSGGELELPGDVLVFLPGKGEIAACAAALEGRRDLGDAEVLELHGGLSLAQQGRAFRTGGRRKVVLATNVAETSVTLPGIGVVVDSGLVRQTRWYRDRGFLVLTPIAADSAEQRKGRAGRTAPGVCIRLWDGAAQLAPRTPPEVHRESLTPLVLAAAACGEGADGLPFLDPPKEEALAAALDELTALGALDRQGRLTDAGRQLFALPLDAALGRLLVEARKRTGTASDPTLLEDVVDLVSTLAVDRRLPPPPAQLLDRHANPAAADPALDPGRCDAVATLVTVRAAAEGRPGPALAEALSTARRLRALYELPDRLPSPERRIHRRALAEVVMAADPRAVHLARRRGGKGRRRVSWAAGGPELELARESAVGDPDGPPGQPPIEAIAVLATHAVGSGFRNMLLLATCAMPLPLRWLVEAGFGEERLGEAAVEGGRLVATVERTWAGRVLDRRREVPRGERARRGLVELFLAGRLFPEAREEAQRRLRQAGLARALARRSALPGSGGPGAVDTAGWEETVAGLYGRSDDDGGSEDEGDGGDGVLPELPAWTAARVAELGVERGEDLELLEAGDLLPPELPFHIRRVLEREYPLTLELPDATYALEYDLGRRTVTLVRTSGSRQEPPPLAFLPRLPGLRVKVRHGPMLRTVREAR